MDVSKIIEITRVDELKILQNVRLLHRSDLNPIISKENLRVQFDVSGEVKGNITCHLCLDGIELNQTERNYYIPLFVEAMNILVGRQISIDDEINHLKISLSAPKISMNSIMISTENRTFTHKYELELEHITFTVLINYHLEALN